MYRSSYKNKHTGNEEMLWNYINSAGEVKLYRDLTLKEEVSTYDYEPVQSKDCRDVLPTPYHLFGIECGKGWYPLIQPVIDYIDDYNKNKSEDEKIYTTQIKEKYGVLEIYTNFYTNKLEELINAASEESSKVCEFCGSRQHLGSTLEWYITICYDCMKDRVNRRGIPSKWHCYDNDNVYLSKPHMPDELLGAVTEYSEKV